MTNEYSSLNDTLDNEKDTFSEIKIEKEFFEDALVTNMDDVKEYIQNISMKEEIKEDLEDKTSFPDENIKNLNFQAENNASNCTDQKGIQNCIQEKEMFHDILMKEEIKEEQLEDEMPLLNQAEERLDYQEENAINTTSEPVVPSFLQVKRQCLSSNFKIRCYDSYSEKLLTPEDRKLLKNLCSTEKEKISTLSHREKPFKCSSCPYQALQIGNLKNHEKTHTGERPFQCSSCSYRALLLKNLKRHERTHTGERPFKCSSCSYRAIDLGALKKHERTHTGERPFKCNYCSYRATESGTLKKHERSHTGERPFKCMSCSYQATHIGSLKRHERIHTGEKPFKCSSCSYQARELGTLKTHQKTHRSKTFKCSSCSYEVGRKTELKRHLTTHSGE